MKQLPSAMPANVARANFYQMLDEAGEDMRQFTIVPRSKPPIIVMSVAEFEGWQETIDIMSDKKLVASIKRGLKSKKSYTEKEAYKILGWKK
jgi:prevent-host-death family protein